jgi:hypothetical protein
VRKKSKREETQRKAGAAGVGLTAADVGNRVPLAFPVGASVVKGLVAGVGAVLPLPPEEVGTEVGVPDASPV